MSKPKFRAWYKPDFDTPDGPFKFGQKVINDEIFFVMESDEDIAYKFDIPWLDDDWILEQFTGLRDLNGKEIYEGDILDGFDEVKFKDGRYYCNLKGSRVFTLEELCCDMDYLSPEIVGNIHENPELIK